MKAFKYDTMVYYVVNWGTSKRFRPETYNNFESAKKRCLQHGDGRMFSLIDGVRTFVFRTSDGEVAKE